MEYAIKRLYYKLFNVLAGVLFLINLALYMTQFPYLWKSDYKYAQVIGLLWNFLEHVFHENTCKTQERSRSISLIRVANLQGKYVFVYVCVCVCIKA